MNTDSEEGIRLAMALQERGIEKLPMTFPSVVGAKARLWLYAVLWIFMFVAGTALYQRFPTIQDIKFVTEDTSFAPFDTTMLERFPLSDLQRKYFGRSETGYAAATLNSEHPHPALALAANMEKPASTTTVDDFLREENWKTCDPENAFIDYQKFSWISTRHMRERRNAIGADQPVSEEQFRVLDHQFHEYLSKPKMSNIYRDFYQLVAIPELHADNITNILMLDGLNASELNSSSPLGMIEYFTCRFVRALENRDKEEFVTVRNEYQKFVEDVYGFDKYFYAYISHRATRQLISKINNRMFENPENFDQKDCERWAGLAGKIEDENFHMERVPEELQAVTFSDRYIFFENPRGSVPEPVEICAPLRKAEHAMWDAPSHAFVGVLCVIFASILFVFVRYRCSVEVRIVADRLISKPQMWQMVLAMLLLLICVSGMVWGNRYLSELREWNVHARAWRLFGILWFTLFTLFVLFPAVIRHLVCRVIQPLRIGKCLAELLLVCVVFLTPLVFIWNQKNDIAFSIEGLWGGGMTSIAVSFMVLILLFYFSLTLKHLLTGGVLATLQRLMQAQLLIVFFSLAGILFFVFSLCSLQEERYWCLRDEYFDMARPTGHSGNCYELEILDELRQRNVELIKQFPVD